MSVVRRRAAGESPYLQLVEESLPLSKGKARKRRKPRWIRLSLSILGIYLLFSFAVGGYEIFLLKKQMGQMQIQQNILLDQRNELEKQIASLHNPEVIEKIARENLGMVKPGEVIILEAIPEKNIPKPKDVKDSDIAH